MLSASEARKITNENGRQRAIDIAIKQVEKKVMKASENGCNSICYGLKEYFGGTSFMIDDEYIKLPEVREHFIKQGFKFKDTGYCNGVYQDTEDMYW